MFYNIHTHNACKHSGVFCIKNIHQGFEKDFSGQNISMGMHPWYLKENEFEEQFAILKNNVIKPHVLAIGECGLDKRTSTDWNLQLKAFQLQIDLAQEVKKPIIIHCVKAFSEVLGYLKNVEIPVIFHGVNNKRSILNPVIAGGHYLSFGKSLLNGHENMLETFRITPLEQVFLETDDADADIEEIYKSAAGIKNITEKEIVLQLEQNFLNVFQ